MGTGGRTEEKMENLGAISNQDNQLVESAYGGSLYQENLCGLLTDLHSLQPADDLMDNHLRIRHEANMAMVIYETTNHSCSSNYSSTSNLANVATMLNDEALEFDSAFGPASIKVDEYDVAEENVSLLHSIFSKYGDIAKSCTEKSTKYRSFFLKNVCDLYRKLELADPKKIKIGELKAMIDEVGILEKYGLEVEWLRERLIGINHAMYAFKSHSYLKEEFAKNNQDREMKMKEIEIEGLEAKGCVVRNELDSIKAKGEKVKAMVMNTKSELAFFYKRGLFDGLL